MRRVSATDGGSVWGNALAIMPASHTQHHTRHIGGIGYPMGYNLGYEGNEWQRLACIFARA